VVVFHNRHSGRLATSGERPAAQANGRRTRAAGRPKAAANVTEAAPRRSFVAQTEKSPCRSHPLDQGKSDQTPAGLLARGSSLDARPSRASQDFASGPVACPSCLWGMAMCIALAAYSCRDSLGFGRRASFTMFPFKPLSRHRRDHTGWTRMAWR